MNIQKFSDLDLNYMFNSILMIVFCFVWCAFLFWYENKNTLQTKLDKINKVLLNPKATRELYNIAFPSTQSTPLTSLLNLYIVKIIPIEKQDGGGYKAWYKELGWCAVGYGDTREMAMQELNIMAIQLLQDEPIDSLPSPIWVDCQLPHPQGVGFPR